MSVVFKDATLLIAGYDHSGQLNQVGVDLEAESLDATVFGNASRVKRGGLTMGRITASGFWQAGSATAVDQTFFENIAVSDVVVCAFPETITEGATSTGSGYMLKAELVRYQFGGAIGVLTPFSIEAVGRGVQS